jgi:hypothetical protein
MNRTLREQLQTLEQTIKQNEKEIQVLKSVQDQLTVQTNLAGSRAKEVK